MLLVDLDFDATDHPIVALRVYAAGGTIVIMGEVVRRGEGLELRGVHIHSDAGANGFGGSTLRRLVRALMEMFNVDFVLVEGTRRAGRTNPGNRTRLLRFARKAAS